MSNTWARLKNAIDAAVTDLRFLSNTQRVPFNLIREVLTLEWIVANPPMTLDAQDALVMTVKDCLANLDGFTETADDYGYTVLRDGIAATVRSVRPALAGYSN